VRAAGVSKFYLLALLIVFTILIYYPALQSRFLLDDVYNLAGLNDIETNGFAYYIL